MIPVRYCPPVLINYIKYSQIMAKEIIMGLAYRIVGGKFVPEPGREIGKILEDGTIEGTPYKMDTEHIHGGVAITTNSELERDGDSLWNPATDEEFTPTIKKTGFFSKTTKTFFKPYGKR